MTLSIVNICVLVTGDTEKAAVNASGDSIEPISVYVCVVLSKTNWCTILQHVPYACVLVSVMPVFACFHIHAHSRTSLSLQCAVLQRVCVCVFENGVYVCGRWRLKGLYIDGVHEQGVGVFKK